MHRHSNDLVGLLFGLAFAIAGISFLVSETTDANIDPAWAAGVGLMLLGTVALVATLARATGRDRLEPAPCQSFEAQSFEAQSFEAQPVEPAESVDPVGPLESDV